MDISTTSAKYNWWTHEDKKKDISPLSQLASIMQHGDAQEVFEIFRMSDEAILRSAYARIERDRLSIRDRRHAYIRSLLAVKQTHIL